MVMKAKYRFAVKEDMASVLSLIKELAAFEKAENSVTNTIDQLEKDGFSKSSLFKVIVAEIKFKIVGMALYYPHYSTWKGKCIYLDDIIVTKKERKKGIGKTLMNMVIKDAKKFGAKLVLWEVLDWNKDAIEFYKKLDAHLDNGWMKCKVYLK